MEIFEKKERLNNSLHVYVALRGGKKSKSFTVHDTCEPEELCGLLKSLLAEHIVTHGENRMRIAKPEERHAMTT
jgi:hypothetical protein